MRVGGLLAGLAAAAGRGGGVRGVRLTMVVDVAASAVAGCKGSVTTWAVGSGSPAPGPPFTPLLAPPSQVTEHGVKLMREQGVDAEDEVALSFADLQAAIAEARAADAA